MKIYSNFRPPKWHGQKFTKPSLTDQLADEPLERVYQRYVQSGAVPPLLRGDVDVNASDAELEAAMNDLATDDVSQMSRVEQADVLVNAQRLVEQLQAEAVSHAKMLETGHERPGVNAATNDSLKEGKIDTSQQNG